MIAKQPSAAVLKSLLTITLATLAQLCALRDGTDFSPGKWDSAACTDTVTASQNQLIISPSKGNRYFRSHIYDQRNIHD
jgi:hypothetical protein